MILMRLVLEHEVLFCVVVLENENPDKHYHKLISAFYLCDCGVLGCIFVVFMI